MKITDNVIELHQSDIDSFVNCPEQSRLNWFHDGERRNTDATAAGTSMHSGAEFLITLKKNGVVPTQEDFDNAIDLAMTTYRNIEVLEGIEYVQLGSQKAALRLVEKLVIGFYSDILPLVLVDENTHTEWSFEVPFIDHKEYTIVLAGQADCVESRGIWDWKSAGQAYKQWEKQRWAVQPTVYSYAAVTLGLLDWPVRFNYGVVDKSSGRGTKVPVMRGPGHIEWLAEQVRGMVDYMHYVGPDKKWLLRDDSALCGPKWCPFYDGCKGKYLTDAEFMWKPSAQ